MRDPDSGAHKLITSCPWSLQGWFFDMWRQIEMIGIGGFRTLSLAMAVMLATGGVSWVWCCIRVIATAITTPTNTPSQDLVVFGHRLRDDTVSRRFAERLDRALALHGLYPARRILLLGGVTGGASRSEADAGRIYLREHGAPSAVIAIEDRSRHTLENLREARDLLCLEPDDEPPVFVTSRHHLARTAAMAKGLRLEHRLCAAEERFQPSILALMSVFQEAFFLHSYWVGRRWSEWTGAKSNLDRIT